MLTTAAAELAKATRNDSALSSSSSLFAYRNPQDIPCFIFITQ
jgi:hypothetical protein